MYDMGEQWERGNWFEYSLEVVGCSTHDTHGACERMMCETVVVMKCRRTRRVDNAMQTADVSTIYRYIYIYIFIYIHVQKKKKRAGRELDGKEMSFITSGGDWAR